MGADFFCISKAFIILHLVNIRLQSSVSGLEDLNASAHVILAGEE